MKRRHGNSITNSILITAIILVIVGSGFAAFKILSNTTTDSLSNLPPNVEEFDDPSLAFSHQESSITRLSKTLQIYHFVFGEFPSDLQSLLRTTNELSEYCQSNDRDPALIPSIASPEKIQCGQIIWSDNQTIVKDEDDQIDYVYTGSPYQYSVNQDKQDFQLKYQMRFYRCQGQDDCINMSDQDKDVFIDGDNIASKDFVSREKGSRWDKYEPTAFSYLKSLFKPEVGVPVLSNVQTKVFPQDLGNGIIHTYVTVTWTTNFDTDSTIAYGRFSQKDTQEYFRGEGGKLAKDHRVDFNIRGPEPIHYVIRSCVFGYQVGREEDSLLCVRTVDQAINVSNVPMVQDGPVTITSSPVVYDFRITDLAQGASATWSTISPAKSRIGCASKEPRVASIPFGMYGESKSSFFETLSLEKGRNYSCSIEAFNGYSTSTFPLKHTSK